MTLQSKMNEYNRDNMMGMGLETNDNNPLDLKQCICM